MMAHTMTQKVKQEFKLNTIHEAIDDIRNGKSLLSLMMKTVKMKVIF